MNIKQITLSLSAILIFACGGCGGGGSSDDSSGGSTPNVAGQYNVTITSTPMTCNGTSVPVATITEVQAVTQTGNRFSTISSNPNIPAGGGRGITDCPLNSDGTFSCEVNTTGAGGGTTQAKHTGSFTGGSLENRGEFLVTTGGIVCTWISTYTGEKI